MWQARLPDGPVIVKQLVAGPEAVGRYAREVTALRLAGPARPPVTPRLLGTDPDERVLVLEYLEHRPPGDDWVVGYAEALARLHAVNVSGSLPPLPPWAGPSAADVSSFLALARQLGAAIPAGVRAELDDLVERLARAGRHSLLHGDPCPDNAMHTPGGVRFVDFEYAAQGDGRVELAYLRIGFPTCWCATAPAPELLAAAEAAYRTAWNAATGTDAPEDLTDACAGWLLCGGALVQRAERGSSGHLNLIPDQDWTWGTATARQRLAHRLGVVGQLTAETGPEGPLAGLGRLAGDVRGRMLARWPGLPPLPARKPAW